MTGGRSRFWKREGGGAGTKDGNVVSCWKQPPALSRGRDMDEAAWYSCELLYELLHPTRERMSDRQRRLFAVACCARAGRQAQDSRSLRALEVAGRHADGRADLHELREAKEA